MVTFSVKLILVHSLAPNRHSLPNGAISLPSIKKGIPLTFGRDYK